MLRVTDEAATLIRTALEESETKEGMCFRLVTKEETGEFGFDFGDIRSREDDDYIFESEGCAILIVGKEDNKRLIGMKLDVSQNEDGKLSLAIKEA